MLDNGKERLESTYVDHSVSHDTMLTEDLFEAIKPFLELSEEGRQLIEEFDDSYENGDDDVYSMDVIMYDDIFPHMNEIAPEGCYFGSHPGNGSDFGFWKVKEEWEDG